MTKQESEIIFEEVQQFSKKSARDFFKILFGVVLVAVIVNLVIQKGKMTDFNWLLTILLSLLLFASIILNSKLIMQIRTDGIYVRFPPLQPLFSKYFWIDISEVYIMNYEAMREFDGWGIRYAPRSMGYIVAGNKGIQIVLKNGYKILITTQREIEVNEVLKKIEKV